MSRYEDHDGLVQMWKFSLQSNYSCSRTIPTHKCICWPSISRFKTKEIKWMHKWCVHKKMGAPSLRFIIGYWFILFNPCLLMFLFLYVFQIYYELSSLPPPLSYKCSSAQRLYRHMRHPGAICLLLLLWLHPVLTVDRCVLAYLASVYVLYGFSIDDEDYSYVRQQADRKRFAVAYSCGTT